ncbi:hypothetical protein ACFWHT_06585 [Microbacterium sp. NPDC058342]|uniref:hypothetical protein n=1 Tax=Microbacterium sp. NPDC058342 TaxID=3346454 RepID=UPI0036520D67
MSSQRISRARSPTLRSRGSATSGRCAGKTSTARSAQKTFPIKADRDDRTDTRARKVKPRPIERIAKLAEEEAARFCIQIDLELEAGKSTAPMTGKSQRFREVAALM